MRIQHNISALNASNKLKINENSISKNIAKLSSGYRINSAADDAAGLAVSEKMRAQINGLNQAQDNTKNGISLIQTAEGGLNETSAILQRMNTLAVESSNGTYQDTTDRANLDKEVTALKDEVNRISTSTNFNQINLLDGSLSASGASQAAATSITVSGLTAEAIDVASNHKSIAAVKGAYTTAALSVAADDLPTAGGSGTKTLSYTVAYKTADGTAKTKDFTFTLTADDGATIDGKITGTNLPTAGISGTKAAAGGGVTAHALLSADVATALSTAINADKDIGGAFTASVSSDGIELVAKTAGTHGETLIGVAKGATGLAFSNLTPAVDAYTQYDMPTAYDGTNASGAVFTVNGKKFAFVEDGKNADDLGSDVNALYLGEAGTTAGASDAQAMSSLINSKTGLATAPDGTNTTHINFKTSTDASHTAGKGVVFQVGSDNKDDQTVTLNITDMSAKGLGIADVSVGTQPAAKAAIDTIKNATNMVSAQRAQLGALQNELEHTSNNLSTMGENLTSAESTIRDVDMTDEYVQYSKNQILSQAANAMLAQANAQPQNVLSLLKG